MSENIISVNIPNMISIGIMFVLFTLLIHGITKIVRGSAGASDAESADD